MQLKNGTVLEERQGQLRGGAKQPLSRDEVISKAQANLVFAGWQSDSVASLERFAASLFASPDQDFSALPLATLEG